MPTRVLLIEDNLADARLIETVIDRFQAGLITFIHAPDLGSGLTSLEENRIEALLLDLSLPDSDGLDTFHQVHNHSPHLPVIILTGRSDDKLALDAMRVGAQDYIVKGDVDGETLIRALRYAIERNRREVELEAVAMVSKAIKNALTQSEIIEVAVPTISEVLDARAAGFISLANGQDEEMYSLQGAYGRWSDLGAIAIDDLGVAKPMLEDLLPRIINNTDDPPDPRLRYLPFIQVVRSIVMVPLILENKAIGIFGMGRDAPFDQYEVNILQTIANLLASALERANLFERSQRQIGRLRGLRNIDTAIATSFSLEHTLQVCLDEAINQLEVDAAAISLMDANNQLTVKAAKGFLEGLPTSQHDPGESYTASAMAGMATQIILDFDKKPDVQPRPQKFAEENIVSYAVSPLVEQGRGIGVLEVFNRSRLHIDEEWVNYFETIAGQTGIAIHTADLISEVQKGKQDLEVAYDATLEGWVRALDMRDNETEGHTQRVTHLTLKLARRMGKFSATELQDIYRGALLHDIGKMAVPDEILHKPGPLNDAEWAIMRDHTTFARNFLEPIDYLREAMAIPYNHHEKWDGSGYPQGLVGEAIPLVARIFAVVDVYDALTSDRPYRKALPVQEVLAYIEDNTGSHFEPEVVVEFLAMMRELDDLPA